MPEILLIGDVTADRLDRVLDRPFRSYVEFQPDDTALPDRIRAAVATRGFYLTLSTCTAYYLADTAHRVCRTLSKRNALPETLRPNAELALHEVIANAILHGNLGLKSGHVQDDISYARFVESVHAALARDRSRKRWITIIAAWTSDYLDISVADEGEGFPEPNHIEMREDADTTGRGLAIIQTLVDELSFQDGGRTTVLRFNYKRA